MSTEDPDIVEMDFPPYEEEYLALPKLRINGFALSIAVIAVFGIFIADVRKTKASADAAQSEAFASEVIQYMELQRVNYTQVVLTETTAAENVQPETSAAEQDDRKFTAVREPFESDGAVLDFSTQPFKTTDKAEKCDEDFQIPIRSILKYLT